MSKHEWWQEAFQAEYLSIYAHRDDASALAEVQGVQQQLAACRDVSEKHTPSNRAFSPHLILDACCGNGRHAAALADLGFSILAFDYSGDLLKVAKQRPQLQGRIFQADIRHMPFQQSFSAITLFFTAFGYFDDQANQVVLNQLIAALKPGGLLMLDLPNPQQVRDTLLPHSVKETASGLVIDETRRLEGSYVAKDVRVEVAGVLKRSYTERVRLYESAELQRMAQLAGARIESCWPSLIGPEIEQQRQVYWLRTPA